MKKLFLLILTIFLFFVFAIPQSSDTAAQTSYETLTRDGANNALYTNLLYRVNGQVLSFSFPAIVNRNRYDEFVIYFNNGVTVGTNPDGPIYQGFNFWLESDFDTELYVPAWTGDITEPLFSSSDVVFDSTYRTTSGSITIAGDDGSGSFAVGDVYSVTVSLGERGDNGESIYDDNAFVIQIVDTDPSTNDSNLCPPNIVLPERLDIDESGLAHAMINGCLNNIQQEVLLDVYTVDGQPIDNDCIENNVLIINNTSPGNPIGPVSIDLNLHSVISDSCVRDYLDDEKDIQLTLSCVGNNCQPRTYSLLENFSLYTAVNSFKGCSVEDMGEEEVANCRKCLLTDASDPESEPSGAIWTELGCIDPSPAGLITRIFQIGLGIMGGIAILRFIQIALVYQSGDQEKLKEAKSMVMSLIGGVILLIAGIVILKFIGINVLGLPEGFLD